MKLPLIGQKLSNRLLNQHKVFLTILQWLNMWIVSRFKLQSKSALNIFKHLFKICFLNMYSQMWGHCLKCLFFPLFFSGELLCILWALEFFSLPVWLHWPLSSYWTGSMSYYPVRHQCCQQFLGLCKCSICVVEWNE